MKLLRGFVVATPLDAVGRPDVTAMRAVVVDHVIPAVILPNDRILGAAAFTYKQSV